MDAGRPVRLLLVDDETDTRTVARVTLKQLGGFEVFEADSGAAALDLAASCRPDGIILDVMMPGMDGPAVLEHLRASAVTASIPVVFLTAKALPSEIARLRELGARAIISKPFDPVELVKQVRDAMLQGASAPSAATEPEGLRDTQPAGAAFIDRAALAKLKGLTGEDGGSLMTELIELFAETTADTVRRLRELARDDRGGARESERLAHALKTSAATLGASGIAALARNIEHHVAGGRTSEVAAMIDGIAAQLPETIARLREEGAKLAP